MQRRLAVLAPATQAAALAECVARLGSTPRLLLVALADADGSHRAGAPGGDPGGEPGLAARLATHANGPFDGALVLAMPDTAAWAREAVAQAASATGTALLLARGLRVNTLRELLAAGARDFMPWDCHREEARLRIARALAAADTRRRKPVTAADPAGRACAPAPAPAGARHPATLARHATARSARDPRLAALIGDSPAFVDALSRVPRIADCDAGVLILGETGTGKDLFAQAVHYLSPRAGGPCVAVNCGALPADLVEAELFGHARGAFTSAHETRMGLVGQAEGGTLFLDEVDSLPPMAQVKLLRFLQDKEYRPVGAAKAQRADVRIVAACNVDLAGLCERSAFRTDLYYRLNILALHLPALRDRGADVLALAAHFAAGFARRFRRPVYDFAPAARARLLAHAWPGNVRELEHAIERAVLLADGDAIEAGDLGLPPAQEGAPADGGVSVGSPGLESFSAAKARAVAQFERRYIEDALAHCAGNITHAADAVAKNRRAFFELMRKHRIDSAAYREAAARAADESP